MSSDTLRIYKEEQEVGTVTWEKNGMTYVISAVFRLSQPPEGLIYLHLGCGVKWYRLGIPTPCSAGWCLRKRVSVSELRQAGITLDACDRAVVSAAQEILPPVAKPAIPVAADESELDTQETFEPIPEAKVSIPPPQLERIPTPHVETAPTTIEPYDNSWIPAADITSFLSDTVLLPLVQDRTDLVMRRTNDTIQLAMPYDILDEISFTPAFCLMEVIFIDGKTYFALTVDESGWPIAPQ